MGIDEVLNKEELFERLDDDQELLVELIEIFLSEYPESIQSIASAIQAQDPEALRIAAHTLKGAVGNFCAYKAMEAAEQLEMSGRNKDLNSVEADFVSLETEMTKVNAALQDLAESCAS